jgi:hypothetical protein
MDVRMVASRGMRLKRYAGDMRDRNALKIVVILN